MPAIKFPPAKKVTKAQLNYHGVCLDNFPSAGPCPNITGMRRVWGQFSYILKHGRYIFKVPAYIYAKF